MVTPFQGGMVDSTNCALWSIGRSQWHRTAWFRSAPPAKARRFPTRSSRVVNIATIKAAGRVPVIAGAGSNNTRGGGDLARHAEKAGADAMLVVTPYYNKPNQEGLFHHSRRSTIPFDFRSSFITSRRAR